MDPDNLEMPENLYNTFGMYVDAVFTPDWNQAEVVANSPSISDVRQSPSNFCCNSNQKYWILWAVIYGQHKSSTNSDNFMRIVSD